MEVSKPYSANFSDTVNAGQDFPCRIRFPVWMFLPIVIPVQVVAGSARFVFYTLQDYSSVRAVYLPVREIGVEFEP